MIDFTKPVQVCDSFAGTKCQARVIAAHGARAFVTWGTEYRAYAFNGKTGKADGGDGLTLENIPEPPKPIVRFMVLWEDGVAVGHESWCRSKIADPCSTSLAAIKLTYTPGHASVEIIEERK